jgi:hypothetical protein
MKLLERFSKNTQKYNFTKIRPVGAQLSHADGWMDGRTDRHDEANRRFSHFANAPTNSSFLRYSSVQAETASQGRSPDRKYFPHQCCGNLRLSRTIHSRWPQWRQHLTVRYRNRSPFSDTLLFPFGVWFEASLHHVIFCFSPKFMSSLVSLELSSSIKCGEFLD